MIVDVYAESIGFAPPPRGDERISCRFTPSGCRPSDTFCGARCVFGWGGAGRSCTGSDQLGGAKRTPSQLGVPNVGHSAECGSSWATSAFQNARSAGVLPVVASGNDGFLNGISEPACAPGAVRVGAVYDSNVGSHSVPNCTDATTAADKVTCFSNSASFLTLLAPGARITAGGTTRSGTSMAAPHVAGAVAVLRAFNGFPADTLDNTVGRMVNSGVPVRDHRNGIIKPRLNLGRALGLN